MFGRERDGLRPGRGRTPRHPGLAPAGLGLCSTCRGSRPGPSGAGLAKAGRWGDARRASIRNRLESAIPTARLGQVRRNVALKAVVVRNPPAPPCPNHGKRMSSHRAAALAQVAGDAGPGHDQRLGALPTSRLNSVDLPPLGRRDDGEGKAHGVIPGIPSAPHLSHGPGAASKGPVPPARRRSSAVPQRPLRSGPLRRGAGHRGPCRFLQPARAGRAIQVARASLPPMFCAVISGPSPRWVNTLGPRDAAGRPSGPGPRVITSGPAPAAAAIRSSAASNASPAMVIEISG